MRALNFVLGKQSKVENWLLMTHGEGDSNCKGLCSPRNWSNVYLTRMKLSVGLSGFCETLTWLLKY